MKRHGLFNKCIITAVLPLFLSLAPARAAEEGVGPSSESQSEIDALFQDLANAEPAAAARIAARIEERWQRSGSAAMDLLRARGQEALAAQDYLLAIDHLTALTDHAPDFAEGWRLRAEAYLGAGYSGPAVADLGRALGLNPRHFIALRLMGQVSEASERPEVALAFYGAVLAIHPQDQAVKEARERLSARGQRL